jgi:putative peptidoglycan lipid II flippase
MENSKKISHLASRFISGTLLSRIFGMLRDVLMAAHFGATPLVGAFFVAYRLSNLFRRIFAEGGLLNGFIPFFEEIRGKSEKEGAEFFRDLLGSVTLVLLVLTTSLALFLKMSPWTSPIIDLTFVMLPSVLFICLFGVFSAYLHCHHYFFISGAAPILLNVFWIGGIFWAGDVLGLCHAIVLGFFAQCFVVLLASLGILKKQLSFKELLRFKIFSQEVRQMIAPFFVAAIGVSAMQVNSALDGLIARMASLEGPAYLTFASRISQLPLGLFGVGLAVPLLPLLSRAFQAKDTLKFNQFLEAAFERSLFFMIPSVFGIFAVGRSIVSLIYGRGAFDTLAIMQTTYCFWGYALSLIPSSLVILIAPAFYAQKNYSRPAFAAILSVLCNICMSLFLILVCRAGVYSVAVSSSLSSCINVAALVFFLNQEIALKFSKLFWRRLLIMLLAAIIAFLVAQMARNSFVFGFFPFVFIYLALTQLFKISFLKEFFLKIKD